MDNFMEASIEEWEQDNVFLLSDEQQEEFDKATIIIEYGDDNNREILPNIRERIYDGWYNSAFFD